jgi:DnaJ-class molecular chaperone
MKIKTKKCPRCLGTGDQIQSNGLLGPCPECNGRGKIKNKRRSQNDRGRERI